MLSTARSNPPQCCRSSHRANDWQRSPASARAPRHRSNWHGGGVRESVAVRPQTFYRTCVLMMGMGARQQDPSLPQPFGHTPADRYPPVEPAHPDPTSPVPIGLTWEERGGAGAPVTVAPEPISVIAWVRYPTISTHVDARALAWTHRAVYIQWQSRGIHRLWVWASAVDRL